MKNRIIRLITMMMAVALTAKGGVFHNSETGMTETYYDLSMKKVVRNARNMGIPCEYWVRDDGVKMFGPWVIVASHPSITRYSRIQTSLGEGIVLDRHTVDDPDLIDIATAW